MGLDEKFNFKVNLNNKDTLRSMYDALWEGHQLLLADLKKLKEDRDELAKECETLREELNECTKASGIT